MVQCVLFPLLGIFDSVFADSHTTEKQTENKRASTAGVEIPEGPDWERSEDMTGWRRRRREREGEGEREKGIDSII